MDQNTLLSLTTKYPIYITIHASILKCVALNFKSLEDVRSSNKLLKILDSVINQSVAKELAICSMQTSVKSRLNHFVKYMVTLLCVPFFSSMIGEGKGVSLESGSNLESVQRLMTDMLSLFVTAELINDRNDDLSLLDGALVELALSLLFYRSSAFVPLLLTLSSHGMDIVSCITCQLLSVRALSVETVESVELAIAQCSDVLSYYEEEAQRSVGHVISSSDINSVIDRGVEADTMVRTTAIRKHLKPASGDAADVRELLRAPLLQFIVWLRENREYLVRLCRVAEVISFLDGSLVRELKREEYLSPEDVVYTYIRKYKARLSVMPLPVQPITMMDVKQAERDVCRETFSVNNVLISDAFLASDEAKQCTKVHVTCSSWGNGSDTMETLRAFIQWNLEKALSFQFEFGQSPYVGTNQDHHTHDDLSSNSNHHLDSMLELEDSESEGGNDLASSQDTSKQDAAFDTSGVNISLTGNVLSMSHIHSVERIIVERLMRQILIACSRTIAAGDAYSVLNELYGGEGLMLCPRSETAGVSRPSQLDGPSSPTPQRASIVIQISAKGVCVVVRGLFDLYEMESADAILEGPVYQKETAKKATVDSKLSKKNDTERGSGCRTTAPLMSFRTKTTTIVTFKDAGPTVEERIPVIVERVEREAPVKERERIPSDGSLRKETRDSVLKGLKDIYLEEAERSQPSDSKLPGKKNSQLSVLEKSLRLLQEDCEVHRALMIEPFLGAAK